MKRAFVSILAGGAALVGARTAAADPPSLTLTMPTVATSRPLFVPVARVDVVKQNKDGSTFRVGVERKSGTGMQGVPAMVTVGGGF